MSRQVSWGQQPIGARPLRLRVVPNYKTGAYLDSTPRLVPIGEGQSRRRWKPPIRQRFMSSLTAELSGHPEEVARSPESNNYDRDSGLIGSRVEQSV